ncbi:MAG: hypothetical protein M3N13_09230 [Candidatus Eremiobacteraeota bacterium]|nr:hypothetical protein [Candidatus Eremiobacteraeota bacterium]
MLKIEARKYVALGIIAGSVIATGCSGGKTSVPCALGADGSAGAIVASLISPSSGATSVPTGPLTFVLKGFGNYSIVLDPTNAASTGRIQTSPTALPSPAPTDLPGTSGGGNFFAVSVPQLQSATTYTVGTLSDRFQCAGTFQLVPFGKITTQ